MVTAGLLVLRLVIGLTVAAHGAQKLFGWFAGPGLPGFAATLEQLGVRPGRAWAIVASVAEFGGGLLVVLGLMTPIAALFVAGDLLVAIVTVHLARGYWNHDGGFEYPLVLIGGLVALSLVGPGPASLDRVIQLSLPEPATWLAIVVVVLLGVIAAAASGRLQTAGRPKQSVL